MHINVDGSSYNTSQQLRLYVLQTTGKSVLGHVHELNPASLARVTYRVKASTWVMNYDVFVALQNEARKLNHQEVVEEDKRLKLPSNWEAKKARLEYELMVDEKKKVKNKTMP